MHPSNIRYRARWGGGEVKGKEDITSIQKINEAIVLDKKIFNVLHV